MNAGEHLAPEIGLPPAQFASAFPFHLALDLGLRLVQVGSTLQRICPDLRPGASLAQAFRMIQPDGQLTPDWVRGHPNRFYLLEHISTRLQLRGGFVFLPGQELVLFLSSPWLLDSSEIQSRGLSFDDFAVHDPVVDMLHVYQASKVALADARKLAGKLTRQRAELQEANQRLRDREAEARRLALIAARTDNAVVLTDPDGNIVWVNEGFTRLTGYTLEETLGRRPGTILQGAGTNPETVAYVREQLRKGEGFSVELLNYGKTGRSYWVAIEVQPIRDDSGRITNFMAIESDITARRAAQQRLAIQYEVSRVLVQAQSFTEALPKILRQICDTLGWQIGQWWRCEAGRLRLFGGWSPDDAKVATFVAAGRGLTLAAGEGLPGRVWSAGQAVWIGDVSVATNFLRQAAAAQDGLRSAFAFPVRVRGELWGVLEFFSRNIEEPDDVLLKMFDAVGHQIGQFVARREAEEALRQTSALQRAMLDGANYSIISTAPDGVIRTFNSAAERMLGYNSQEVVGQATPALIHDPAEVAERAAELTRELGRPVAPGFEAFIVKAAVGQPDEREWTYIRKDGSRFPVLLSVTALFDEARRVTGYLGIALDITERKEQARELMRAKEAAEVANRAKSEFLATMSHEIRTPMNAVLGMAHLLLQTPLDPKQTEFATSIARSGEALLEVINDILDFSKLEANSSFDLEDESVRLRQLVHEILTLLHPHADQKDVALTCQIEPDAPDRLRSDEGRLRQVLLNLVSNAVKFTEKGSVTVRVRASGYAPDVVRLRFEVADTGIGMNRDDLDRIFQPFTQVDSSASRRRGGTGLGLAISRRIIERMGGQIGVESVLGQGSLFWFELSVRVETGPEPEPDTTPGLEFFDRSASAPPRPSRILVVEDNYTNRRLALFMLESLGYHPDFAGNGLEAVQACDRFDYDVILMDCQMPEMDGFEATREIRRRAAARGASASTQPRIVALTANALQGDRERCLAAGMDGYISKPFSAKELRGALTPAPVTADPATATVEPVASRLAVLFDPARPEHLWAELGSGATELIQDFLAALPQTVDELGQLALRGELTGLARQAHSLLGMALSFGLEQLAELCRELETVARQRDGDRVSDRVQAVVQSVPRSQAALREWLEQRQPRL